MMNKNSIKKVKIAEKIISKKVILNTQIFQQSNLQKRGKNCNKNKNILKKINQKRNKIKIKIKKM